MRRRALLAATPEQPETLAKLEQSLARDRADYAAAPKWARPLVVLRGLFERAVIRALAREAKKQALSKAQPPPEIEPLPPLLREAAHFARVLWSQAAPRAPALIGLAVGWLIAQNFTDSQLAATLHAWGIGSGPRRAVRAETLKAMNYWLPLLAAAVASYASSRLSALIRARYAPADPPC